MMLCAVPQTVRPHHFRNEWPVFVSWRRDMVQALATCYSLSLSHYWRPSPGSKLSRAQVGAAHTSLTAARPQINHS